VAAGDVSGRRRALRDDVTRLAADVGRAVVEAEAVGPPEPPESVSAQSVLAITVSDLLTIC
jgi:hypothetical protein